jgi:hypothetical protein
MALQAGRDKIGVFAVDSPVEVAAADEHEVHEVPGEIQQEPFGRNVATGCRQTLTLPFDAYVHNRGKPFLKAPSNRPVCDTPPRLQTARG